jgi:hypothetical protein
VIDHTHVGLGGMRASEGMPHCKDCRWWARRPVEGSCELVRLLPSKAHVTSIHDGGELITAADFGCVQFEPRDPTAEPTD